MKKFLPLILFISLLNTGRTQYFTQYFDGADTNSWEAVFPVFDTTTTWQVGPPQKTIFDAASTIPNVLVTDTLNTYPDSLFSSVMFIVPDEIFTWGSFIAVQWMQKIDLDTNKDFGLIEVSTDSGDTWTNIYDFPETYNFYGFNPANVGTSAYGDAFTGTDSTWKNIWLCFEPSVSWTYTSLSVRYTIVSDSIETNQEGWMIDNYMMMPTFFHPVSEYSKPDNFKLYPTVTDKAFTLELLNTDPSLVIEYMTIFDISGAAIRAISTSTSRELIDVSDLPPGKYFLAIKTNNKKEIHPIIIGR